MLLICGVFFWLLSLQSLVNPCNCRSDVGRALHIKIRKVSKVRIPACVRESSGLVALGDTLLSINDSGGLPYIYRFRNDGQLIDSVLVEGATNNDWEEMALAPNGSFLVGDVGNNRSNRQNLCFYEFEPHGPTVVRPFHYANQYEFPPVNKKTRVFDCEAFVPMGDSVLLITKNRRPKLQMVYVLDSGNVAKSLCKLGIRAWVTAAARIDSSRFALLAYGKLMVCSIARNKGKVIIEVLKCKKIPFARQAEAVAFDAASGRLYVTNEQGQLFVFQTNGIL